MDYTVSDLKKKRVVSLGDGKDLGRVADVNFSYPDGKVIGLIITDKKKFFGGEKYLLKITCIEKIGSDAILVREFEKREQNGGFLTDIEE